MQTYKTFLISLLKVCAYTINSYNQCSISHNEIFFLSGNIFNNSIPIETTFTWSIIDVSGHPWSTLQIETQEKIKEYFEHGRNNMSVWINVKKPIDKESLLSFIKVRLAIDIAKIKSRDSFMGWNTLNVLIYHL